MSEAQTLTIVGVFNTLEETTSGFTKFAIEVPGKQYPVKVGTKREDIIASAKALRGQVATWTYTEKDGNPNPHKPGTNYKDRYLESVVAGATAEAQAATSASNSGAPTPSGSPPVEAHHPQLHEADRQRAILRQACIKAAAELYGRAAQKPPDPEDEYMIDWPLEVMKAADRFERWVTRDLDDIPF